MLHVSRFICLASALSAPALAAPVQWVSGAGANGHYYEFVASQADWVTANALAEATSFQGEQGHLASIHSAAENDFIYRLLRAQPAPPQAAAWMGGYQTPPVPEVAPGLDWHWTSGEAFDFTNWYATTLEPNNFGGFENYLQIYNYGRGGWNDCSLVCDSASLGYFVEYVGTLPVGGVPEPMMWTGLVIGFGLIGGVARAGRTLRSGGYAEA